MAEFDAYQISRMVKERARELGFSHVGVACVGEPGPEAERLRLWLLRNYDAGMDWMRRRAAERIDPRRVVAGARSVISVAMNYYTPHGHSTDRSRGKVSRYAWGDDYHDILGTRLEELWGWMRTRFPSADGKWYVDTGPVMEKVWAERAGVGWIGKHTNVITQEIGSWVFLGEIITTLDLHPDEPATDHCGTCTLCIEACPTGAIVEPYVLDARLCLSYLTIEHRGEVEGEVTSHYDGWIFGCDICQDVCPWNRRFAVQTGERGFAPREDMLATSLDEWAGMSAEEFFGRTQGSPVRRARHEGMQRNARIVRRGTTENDPR